MKYVKVYRCDCGEDVFEGAVSCIGCGKPEDKSRHLEVEIAESVRDLFSTGSNSRMDSKFRKKAKHE